MGMSPVEQDIRWQQRLQHFEQAFAELEAACRQQKYSKLERGGLIQAFEFTFELAWKTLQDILESKGYQVRGPRPVFEQAFQDGLIQNGEVWMKMLKSRNLTTHTYHEQTAEEIAVAVKTAYWPEMSDLIRHLRSLV